MEITLIGTGNLGANLYAALRKAGHEVSQLQGRNFRGEDLVGDVVIVCVKDDVISSVVEKLKDAKQLILHTSGSQPIDVIPSPRRGVLYPMQTFSKSRLVDFDEIPVFVEANSEEDTRLLEQLAKSISNNIHRLDSQRRRCLHLAAVFACNFVNHCYHLSAEILKEADIPFEVMLPLIDETARKVHALPPAEAQTGPAVRYDQSIIEKHENMLHGTTREIYHLMSQGIHDKLRFNEN